MAEEFDKAFDKTGAGSDVNQQSKSSADDARTRRENLKDMTEAFSKKNLFGKEAPNEEATQKAVLEAATDLNTQLSDQLASQRYTAKSAAATFNIFKRMEEAAEVQATEAVEEKFEDNQKAIKSLEQQESIKANTLEAAEAQKEQAVQGAERGSMIGKLGKGLAMAGLGAAGLGVALLMSAKAAKEFQDVDGKKIATNIKDVLSINEGKLDGEGGLLKFYAEGGTLIAVLTGLGIGLGIFGVGSAAAGAAEKFAGFDGSSVAKNVLTLLSIKDNLGGNLHMLTDSAFFYGAMVMLGAGLGIFGVGAAVAGAGMTIGDQMSLEEKKTVEDGVAKFSQEGFADAIKRNVMTLLSISDEVGGAVNLIGEGLTFGTAMTAIAIGLSVFAAGSMVSAYGAGADEVLKQFTDGTGFADTLKANVLTLLSISDEVGGKKEFFAESGTFMAAMTAISVGVGLFGGAQVVAAIGDYFTKDDFADTLKKNVGTLLSIADTRDNVKQDADDVKYALKTISEGMALYGSNNLSTAFDNFKAGILEFFTSGDSPLDVALQVADRGEDLKTGADGMKNLAGAFESFGKIDMSKLKVDPDFADDLEEFTSKLNEMFGSEDSSFAFMTFEGEESQFNSVIQATEVFDAFADSMERVSIAGAGLATPNLDGLQLNLSGGGTQTPVIVQNIIQQGATTTQATSNTVISSEFTDSTSTSITETN
tara:strand:+ start:2610 stop:4724 length:2115 start_codon:yes stop_codon:yes gene_type:complete